MSKEAFDFVMKIVLAGPPAVGKSNVLSRFTRNQFNLESKTTVGVEFASRDVVVDNKVIRVQLWDTAGQERYKSMTQGFYRNAIGIFLVYEITRKDTFEEIQKWLKECKQFASPYAKICLLGNKSDLTNMREVSKVQALNYANDNNMLFCECSALTGDGIEKALQMLVSEIYDLMQNEEIIIENPLNPRKDSISIKSQRENQPRKLRCCFSS